MNEEQVAEAVKNWALETCPDLVQGYHWLSAQKGALPDVMVTVDEKAIVQTHPAFPYAVLEQVDLRVFEVFVAFMAENDGGPSEADRLETFQLREFGRLIEEALHADATLGDRVPMASPFATFDYRLPFVEYPDGTRGRQMTVTMYVAEPIESSH